MERVVVIGGGLAGSECALQLAARGVLVTLYEQRPVSTTAAHHTAQLAELVCSNSLKATRLDSAAGLLKAELKELGCVLLNYAEQNAVNAGGALAVDRDAFSAAVSTAIEENPAIELVREEVKDIPSGHVVIAAGPLCSPALMNAIEARVGNEERAFYDAAAPIVDAETIDMTRVFRQSRYEREAAGDYLNCPFERASYEAFWTELVGAERVHAHDFETHELFSACQPVEEVARKGVDTLRFGALKPVGLTDPATGHRPWAAAQLRAENAYGTAYNLVGFQTNLTWPEQKRVFRMIPGLEQAEFFRYGVMHRNSFLDSPHALDTTFALPQTTIRFAGQITGTEGYVEAIASGLLAALNTYAELVGAPQVELPKTGALGSLIAYATDPATTDYQPMHVNFGLMPPLSGPRLKKRERYQAYAERGLADLVRWHGKHPELFCYGEGRAL